MNAVQILVSLVQFECIYNFLNVCANVHDMNNLDLNLSLYCRQHTSSSECA